VLEVPIKDRRSPDKAIYQEYLLSQTQAILVVVRGHDMPRDNSGRIGRPKYKNLKIRKERGERRTLYRYI
jgi:hypothetical protein